LDKYNQKTEYDSLGGIGGGIFDIFAGLPLFVFIKGVLLLLNQEEIHYWKVLLLSLAMSLSHPDS